MCSHTSDDEVRMCVVMLLLQKLGMCTSTSVTEVKDGCV